MCFEMKNQDTARIDSNINQFKFTETSNRFVIDNSVVLKVVSASHVFLVLEFSHCRLTATQSAIISQSARL